MNQISMDLFKGIFQKNITVMLDWDRLIESDSQISVIHFTNKLEIESFYTPWHLNDQNQEIGYDGTSSKPLKLSEIELSLNYLNAKRFASISALVASFNQYNKPVEIYAPLYKFSDSEYFIMDANHKLSALMMADVPFSLVAFVIEAPQDKQILNDLENLV